MNTLGVQRLERYRAGAADADGLLENYLENARLCRAVYLPINVFEVVVRNGIAAHLKFRFGDAWYSNPALMRFLDGHHARALGTACADLVSEGHAPTSDRVTSLMSLGFWVHATTKRKQAEIWARGWKVNFPYGYKDGKTLSDLHAVLDRARVLRNRAFHMQAIYDRNVDQTVSEMTEAVSWRCSDTASWLQRHLR